MFLAIKIVNNTFLIAKNTFSQGQGGSKRGQNQKKISISDSATQKLSKGEIKKIRGVTL